MSLHFEIVGIYFVVVFYEFSSIFAVSFALTLYLCSNDRLAKDARREENVLKEFL